MPIARWLFALPFALSIAQRAAIARADGSAPAPAASSDASSHAATSAEPPIASAAERRRRREAQPAQVETVTVESAPDRDRQAFAVGIDAGLAYLLTRGSGAGVGAASFGFDFDFGLGPGGAHVPWTLEAFISFAITPDVFRSNVQPRYPDRFTSFGARLVYRATSGVLERRWLSIGAGLVWTSFGRCDRDEDYGQAVTYDALGNQVVAPSACINHGTVKAAPMIDLGAGLYEWTARAARYGFALRSPIELSSHPGIGLIGLFYGTMGLGR